MTRDGSNEYTTSCRPCRIKRAVVFKPQGLLGLDNLEEDSKVS